MPQGEPYNVRLTPDLETAIRRVERAQTRANHFDIGFVDARIDAGADEEGPSLSATRCFYCARDC